MNHDFRDRVGLGMYTVHNSVQKNMYETFCALLEMGYRAIEFYGPPQGTPAQMKRCLHDSGLQLTGWHVEWRDLQADAYGATVRLLQETGCPAAVIPCLGGKWRVNHGPEDECEELWLRYADQINTLCRHLEKEGIRTGYHNHEHEFLLQYNGQKVFDLLFDHLDTGVIMEFDSGNCIEGGENPLRILEKYRDRSMILHLKPYSAQRGFDTVLGEPDDLNDWSCILGQQGRQYLWMLIESENTALPELENAALCMKGLEYVTAGKGFPDGCVR